MSGCSSCGGVCFWVEGAVTLLTFPYLRVGVLLAYGVSGVSGLRRRSRLPFVVRPPFLVSVCPSPFLGLGWLGHRFVAPPVTPGFWTLLMLGCAVLTPQPLAAPSPFVAVDFFLGRLFGLGLVGRDHASVPSFFWWLPFPCPGFRLAVLAVWWPRRLLFSWILPWVLPSRFQVG